MKKNILITGASGMLGATLVQDLKDKFNVYATGNSLYDEQPLNYKLFDLSNESYEELINWSNPDIIILSGALTNGNFCKENPNAAFSINGISVDKILKVTNSGVKIIYISTDAVFPSSLHMAKETDCVFPENIYGKSKELGEFFLLNSDRNFTIIRTTIVGFNINSKKSGFVEWIINSVKSNEEIGLFNDVIFTPISIFELSREILFLIDDDRIESEVLHIAGSEAVSKYTFGIELLKSLNLGTETVKESSILSFKDRAKRCTDQTLSVDYYQNKYNRSLPNLSRTIKFLKNKYNEFN